MIARQKVELRSLTNLHKALTWESRDKIRSRATKTFADHLGKLPDRVLPVESLPAMELRTKGPEMRPTTATPIAHEDAALLELVEHDRDPPGCPA